MSDEGSTSDKRLTNSEMLLLLLLRVGAEIFE